MGGFINDEEDNSNRGPVRDSRGRLNVADYEDDGGYDSLRTDAPKRWTDISDRTAQKKTLTDAEITRAIEHRFGITPNAQNAHKLSTPESPHSINRLYGAGAALHTGGLLKGATKALNGEVLEPHTLAPGSAPNLEMTAMQSFCGASAFSWGPIVHGHFSACFIQTFLLGLVNLAFIVVAVNRLRSLLSTPPPPPRALTRPALLKVGGAALMAVYLIAMFAIHLAFDYGAPFQWLAYPTSCVTWSLCVAVLLLESRVGAPTNWVCRSFWISSFVVASFLLWANLSEMDHISSSDMAAFGIHYVLYAGMAAMAVFLREDPHDYSKLAMDFAEMSFEEDKTSGSEDGASHQPKYEGTEPQRSRTVWKAEIGMENYTTLRRILVLFADERWHALTSVACCFIGAPIEIVQFIYIGMVVDDCAVPDGPRALGGYVAVLVALYLMQAVSSASQLILTMMVGERMVSRLRHQAFLALVKQDISFLEGGGGARVQDMCGRAEQDVQRLQEAATLRSSMLLQSLIQILVGTVFLWALSWKLTLIALAILPIIALLMLAQSTVLQSYSKRTVEVLNQMEFLASDVISNLKTVRSMARENAEKARFGNEMLVCYKRARAMGIAHGIADGVGVLVLKGCMVLGILYGGTLVHDNELSGGILVSYVFIALQVVMAMSVLPPLIGDMTKAMAAAGRIFEMLDRSPTMNMRGGLTLPSIEGRIEFKDVTFCYPSQPDMPALNRFSMVVEATSHVAICGASGCGKTSILALVERFFDPQQGLVLMDDTDVSSFDPQWLRQQIVFVPQEPLIFSCSIAANIAYGQSDATQQQIEAAAQSVGLHGLILALPEGYRTEISKQEDVSKGMKALIGLARGAVKGGQVVLLDEPLAGLTGSMREAALAGLVRMVQGRTAISVTQEAGGDVAVLADKVLVVSKGSVIEVGRHAELHRLGGLYKSLAAPGGSDGHGAGRRETRGEGRAGQGAGRSRVIDLLDEVEALIARDEGHAAPVDEIAHIRHLY